MKSYTDLEQSKKLAEFLPLESADMYYTPPLIKGYTDYIPHLKRKLPIDWDIEQAIPCWSLSALLDILRYPTLTQDVENKWHITDWTGFYPKSKYGFDSPIDACYEMIIWLLENKKYETT